MENDPVLDQVILPVSDKDALTFRDFAAGGCLIFGGLGSGKSSSSATRLSEGLFKSGAGAFINTIKSDETAHWLELAKCTNRLDDVVLFNAESGLSFDFVHYLWNVGGRAAGQIETVVEMFNTVMAIGTKHSDSSGQQYFENAVAELMRATLVILSNAHMPISIISIHKVLTSLPASKQEADDPKWEEESYCAKVINELKGRRREFTESQWLDLEEAIKQLLFRFPELDPRTKSNVESTWSGLSSRFLYDPWRSMFCSGRADVRPEDCTHSRKIIIADMPGQEYGKGAAKLCQLAMRLAFQRAWLRHQYKPGCCNGAFIFCDELPHMMHRDEHLFNMVCRSSGVISVGILQSLSTLAAEQFHEQTPGAATLGYVGLHSVLIFHSNPDVTTNEFASRQLGHEWKTVEGWNHGLGEDRAASVSGQKQYLPSVEPHIFQTLLKPDGQNKWAQAIVYAAGRRFEATKNNLHPNGTTYISTYFSRP